jgi:histidinol-phosphate aminotransferase
MFNPENILRQNIRALKAYSSARDEADSEGKVLLDANENRLSLSRGNKFASYPDPQSRALRAVIAGKYNLSPENVFVGNGSDEAIDLLIRCFCNPGQDSVLIFTPTYGMYEFCAGLNNVEIQRVSLDSEFQIPFDWDSRVNWDNLKIIFVCNPNNPSGNLIDEAYMEFSSRVNSPDPEFLNGQLVVLRTLSKFYGMAGLRIGYALSDPRLTAVLLKAKPPYNINAFSQQEALRLLQESNSNKEEFISEREFMYTQLRQVPEVVLVYPSEANFFLVRFRDPAKVYRNLLGKGFLVRDRSKVPGCEGCLRITLGTPDENRNLLKELKEI